VTERIDPGGGGMTGATGDLTPEGPEQSFVPGERREVEDPEARGNVTYRQATGAPSQRGEVGDPGGEEVDGGPTDMAERESGYGSEHGLAPDDPAYRMEVNPPAGPTPTGKRRREDRGPRIGGDELKDAEEHF
jgi:hypothetical protein